MWQKYITRRIAVQVAQAWNFGWGKAMKKVYGVQILNTLVLRDNKKTEYYTDKKQHREYIAGLYALLNNEKFVKNFHKSAQKKLENILEKTKKKFNQNFAKLSNQELLKIYKDFILPNVEQFYIRMWTVFNIGEPLTDVIICNLKKYITDDKKRIKYLLSLSSPLKPNDVLNERIYLLKLDLAKKKLSSKDLEKKIKAHTKKYQHIPMFDFDHQPYTEKHFINELKSIKNPQKELKEIKKLFIDHRKEFTRILNKLRPNKKFKNLLQFLKENVYLRDYRDMIRQKLNLELKKFYKEAGKRLGLDVEQIATLANNEIIKYLRDNKKFPKDEIQRREKAYLLIQKENKVQIYSGLKAKRKAKKELKLNKVKKVKKIEGITGSVGKAKGRVKIIYTNKDLNKIKKGDVMVTAMTRQDFVPAMRKISGLITDEGSVTCHAAIISRELSIPCIMATKIATKALKDGNIVEIDANKGIVKIIKK